MPRDKDKKFEWLEVKNCFRCQDRWFIYLLRKVRDVGSTNIDYSPSLSTSYASEISRNFLFASSRLSGFLSGCHLRANFLYLQCEERLLAVSLTRKRVKHCNYLRFLDFSFCWSSLHFQYSVVVYHCVCLCRTLSLWVFNQTTQISPLIAELK